MNKIYIIIVILWSFFSCDTDKNKNDLKVNPIEKAQSEIIKKDSINVLDNASDIEQYANAYIVIADTSQNYFNLKDKMFILHKNTKIKIDTLGRSYNERTNRICLSNKDGDKIYYTDDYFPRRYPESSLSLDYLNFYENSSTENTIALITLITYEKEVAEKQLNIIKKYHSKAFILNEQIFMGCMQ